MMRPKTIHLVGFLAVIINEPPHGKTNNLQKAKTKTQISFAVTATRIVQFLFYFNPKFQASSSFLRLYRSVCVGPGRKPHCWFSHELAQHRRGIDEKIHFNLQCVLVVKY